MRRPGTAVDNLKPMFVSDDSSNQLGIGWNRCNASSSLGRLWVRNAPHVALANIYMRQSRVSHPWLPRRDGNPFIHSFRRGGALMTRIIPRRDGNRFIRSFGRRRAHVTTIIPRRDGTPFVRSFGRGGAHMTTIML